MQGIKTVAALLANRINQAHYVESILRKVFLAGVRVSLQETLTIPTTYMLHWDARALTSTDIVASKYEDDGTPTAWSIRRSGAVMSKLDGQFYCEPLPSSRRQEFFKEFRFESAEEAAACYLKYHSKA